MLYTVHLYYIDIPDAPQLYPAKHLNTFIPCLNWCTIFLMWTIKVHCVLNITSRYLIILSCLSSCSYSLISGLEFAIFSVKQISFVFSTDNRMPHSYDHFPTWSIAYSRAAKPRPLTHNAPSSACNVSFSAQHQKNTIL